MKEKKPIAQPVADLTPKEKKHTRIIGICSVVICLVLLVSLLLVWLHYKGLTDQADRARDVYNAAKEEKGILSSGAELAAWDQAAEANEAYGRFVLYFCIGCFVVAIFGMVGVYALFPYYKDRSFWYLCFHSDAMSNKKREEKK